MRIGELAERTGTSSRSLRYYEQQGLLATRRTANGYRDYDESDLRLVHQIRELLAMRQGVHDRRDAIDDEEGRQHQRQRNGPAHWP